MEDWKILILIGAILILMAGAWYCIKLSLRTTKREFGYIPKQEINTYHLIYVR